MIICLLAVTTFSRHKNVARMLNHSLNQESCIDYFLVSTGCCVNNFVVLDPEVNFSDHLPLVMNLSTSYDPSAKFVGSRSHLSNISKTFSSKQIQLRWDKCDRVSYYYHTGQELEPLPATVDSAILAYELGLATADNTCECIESSYNILVSTLQATANMLVPKCRKGFFKFWWDEELNMLQ